MEKIYSVFTLIYTSECETLHSANTFGQKMIPMTNLFWIYLSSTFLGLFTLLSACSGQPSSTEKNSITDLSSTSLPGQQLADYIVEIFQDSEGNLWFGTMEKGVAKYDGKSLIYFTTADGLIGNTVLSVTEDRDRNLWFGTHSGTSKYDGKTFTNYGLEAGLHGMGCHIVEDRRGGIWAGTNHGVFRFNGTDFESFELPNPEIETLYYKWELGKIWSFQEDKEGNLWFDRDGYGGCKYDGETFTHFTTQDGLPSNIVCSTLLDSRGDIWFSCLSSDFPEYQEIGGLTRYDGTTFTSFPELEGLHQNDVYFLFEDRSGNVWISATGLGVYRYDGKEFSFFPETDRMDLTSRMGLQSMCHDQEGNLWMGFSGGLFRWIDGKIENVTQQSLLEVPLVITPGSVLTAPDDWPTEVIPFPIGFAPSIDLVGYEDLRFAPNWRDSTSANFWTYTFAWYVDPTAPVTAERLTHYFEAYYDGLMHIDAENPDSPAKTKCELISTESGFAGKIHVYDHFATKRRMTLHVQIRESFCADPEKQLILFEASSKPFGHPTWDLFDQVEVTVTCK